MPEDDATALGELLIRAARSQRHRWAHVLAPWDLSPHHARALGVLSGSDGRRLSDLAEALRIAPRSATEVADALQQRGLVERSPDPSDRRAVLLTVTDEGRRVQAEIGEARAAALQAMFDRLSGRERAELGRLLRVLVGEDDRPPGETAHAAADRGHGRP